jgi:2'-5' RNA ligase
VEHVIAPLDHDHAHAVAQLAHDLAAELGLDCDEAVPRRPHVTVVSYEGIEPTRAAPVVAREVAALAPFTVRAHGYGVFAGDCDTDLSLHVMVVRSADLDRLHGRVHRALGEAGARVAGTTAPSAWTPHITLLDRGLTPRLLGDAVEILTRRPHRSWTIPVVGVTITRRGTSPALPIGSLPLRGATIGHRVAAGAAPEA